MYRLKINIKIIIVFLLIVTLINLPILEISQSKSLSEFNDQKFFSTVERDNFDKLINKILVFGNIPSLSVCVIRDREIIWSGSYGLKNIEENQEATIDTSYLVASISKTVTATALLQLYEKGLFDLEDNVNNYLDFEIKNPYFLDINITFKMLLTHTSSLEMEPASFYFINYSSPDPPSLSSWIKDYFYEGINPKEDVWMNATPGSRYKYSNIGYCIVGYLVERISGQIFNDYCKENIFQPLEMYNTSFYLSELNINNIAKPYMLAYQDLRSNPLDIYIPIPHYSVKPYPAYGLRTSVSDLSHFLIAHMNDGNYKIFQLINKTTIQLMHNSHVNTHYKQIHYGLGWINYHRMPKKSGHEGSLFGYNSFMVKYENFKNMGAIFLVNRELEIDNNGMIAYYLIESLLFLKMVSLR